MTIAVDLGRKATKQTNQQLSKTHGSLGKDCDLLCVDALLEVWHVILHTMDTFDYMCDDPFG